MTTAPTLNLLRIEAALSTSSWRPWKAEKDVGRCGNNFLSSERDGEYIGDLCRSQDADLIVELVNAAPAMVARIRELEQRQQELLVTIRNLSASTPYPEEESNAAVLIAKVGTQ